MYIFSSKSFDEEHEPNTSNLLLPVSLLLLLVRKSVIHCSISCSKNAKNSSSGGYLVVGRMEDILQNRERVKI
jgi:hypothetical protein